MSVGVDCGLPANSFATCSSNFAIRFSTAKGEAESPFLKNRRFGRRYDCSSLSIISEFRVRLFSFADISIFRRNSAEILNFMSGGFWLMGNKYRSLTFTTIAFSCTPLWVK